MARTKSTTSGSEETPQAFAETRPRASDMPTFTTQLFFEMSNTLGKMDAKLDALERSNDGLSKQIDGLDDRISGLEHKASILQGFLICAVFLIPLSAAVIWWSLGHRIEEALKIERPSEQLVDPPAPNP